MFKSFFERKKDRGQKQQQPTEEPKKEPCFTPGPLFDIDAYWDTIKDKQIVNEVTPLSFDTPKPEGYTRFVCVSDTHALHPQMDQMPEADVFLHAGDFSNIGLEKDIVSLSTWLRSLPYQHKIVIAGNHDVSFDTENYLPDLYKNFHRREIDEPYDPVKIKSLLTDCTYLEDEGTNVLGFNIYGSPWQPYFYGWAFNLYRDQTILDKWLKIPDNTDILITHGPPLGHGDLCSSMNRAGCHYLLDEIQKRIKCKVHVFGHIHEGYGITTDGHTQYINASTCTLRYRPINPPIIFDLPNP